MLAVAALILLVPAVLPGVALSITTDSMRPTLKAGDLIIIKEEADPATVVKIGDIITFRPNPDAPALITHRVIGKGSDPREGIDFTTQGDANEAPDDSITPQQIRGIYLFRIPKLGLIADKIGGEKRTGVVFIAAGLIVFGLFHVFIGRKRRDDDDDEDDENPPPGDEPMHSRRPDHHTTP
jgi:signal peptidase